jgi:uncharacterized membrane protein
MNPTYVSFGMIVFLGVICHIMPWLTRPTIFFGVTVAPDFRSTPDAKRITRAYQMQIWIHVAIALALGFVASIAHNEILLTLAYIWVGIGNLIALGMGNAAAKQYAIKLDSVREASLAPRNERMPGGPLAWMGPFLILGLSALYLNFHWDQIPERFPVHWGFNGPDRWVTRSVSGVYRIIMIGALSCFLIWLTARLILRSRRVAFRGEALAAEARFRAVNLKALLALEYLIAATFAVLPVITTIASQKIANVGIAYAGIIVVFVVVLITVLVQLGQGGTRLATFSGAPLPIGDHTPDDCWKLGILYVNRNDPAIFVEKRFGIGYTINFGNPITWIVIPAILLLVTITARLAH